MLSVMPWIRGCGRSRPLLGLVENPRKNEMVVQINQVLLREQTVLIRATGQIARIGGDKSPKRWIVFLKMGVHVDFTISVNFRKTAHGIVGWVERIPSNCEKP